jgi:TBC1 domain family protein 5
VIERGEKLGINQAVRDAVGEIRRNVQGLQEARTSGRSTPRDPFVDEKQRQPSFAAALLERRDRQLATMLDETITNLRDMAASNLEGEKDKYIEAIEVAAAKIQFVKVHLEDSSLGLPEEEMPAINALSISSPREGRRPTVALDTTPVVMTSSAVETVRSTLSSPDIMVQDRPTSPPPRETVQERTPPLPVVQELSTDEKPEEMDMDTDMPLPQPEPESNPSTSRLLPTQPPPDPLSDTTTLSITNKNMPKRPPAVPTRSTIAHSSFSWMLEPDSTSASSPVPAFSSSTTSPSSNSRADQGHKKRPSSGRKNNKNAFLFGEVVSSESEGEGVRVRDGEIFGLKSMAK